MDLLISGFNLASGEHFGDFAKRADFCEQAGGPTAWSCACYEYVRSDGCGQAVSLGRERGRDSLVAGSEGGHEEQPAFRVSVCERWCQAQIRESTGEDDHDRLPSAKQDAQTVPLHR